MLPPLLRWLARAVDLLSQLSFLIEICLSLFCSHSSPIIANQMRYRIQKLILFTKIPFITLFKLGMARGIPRPLFLKVPNLFLLLFNKYCHRSPRSARLLSAERRSAPLSTFFTTALLN